MKINPPPTLRFALAEELEGVEKGRKSFARIEGTPSAQKVRLPWPQPVTESVLLVKGPASLKLTN